MFCLRALSSDGKRWDSGAANRVGGTVAVGSGASTRFIVTRTVPFKRTATGDMPADEEATTPAASESAEGRGAGTLVTCTGRERAHRRR
jgi:hypothetical protein